ncbi:MAG TPA: bifunctional YncE family protein/alkaline phosphatase family protein, partial [Tepidisphaeraceae bacterium]|nr:bifunctional YncE family protein/alkaline phosphatase family protein [Tepidisphaeraceae bacterium]
PGAVPGTSVFPLAIAATKDGRRVYAGSERDGGLYVIDASDAAHPKSAGFISTGVNPDALLLNKAQTRLYVGNAGSDTVSIIDTATDKVIGTVLLRPEIAHDLAGATPTGLAFSPDEEKLYVTCGDMNAVAVIDMDEPNGPELRGYVPTGWYPSAVAVSADGQHLFVADAKGVEPRIPHDQPKGKGLGSPLNLIEGVVTMLAVPHSKELPALTQRALAAARLTPADFPRDNPLKDIDRQSGKITHVIYIIKENRTYDQVLGDLPQGNGDPNRCIFGREVTPNLHALAERFVLLDNFYDSGDVSGDGWSWSTQASANENVTRNVPYKYSNRGRRYDYEGQNNDYPVGGFPAKGVDGQPLSDDPRFKEGAKPIPDVGAAPGGHIWDMALKQKLSYRNYGFFVSEGISRGGVVIIPDNYPNMKALQPPGHDLDGITDIDFRRFDLDYPDSDVRKILSKQTGDDVYLTPKRALGKHHASSRFREWKTEFDEMLAKDPSGAAVPALMTVRFCTDHTAGMSAGKHTPRSMVADNDFAVGQLVEAVSHSAIWKNTAIFVVEDDAQNGPDHVDIHRSTCYIISPYIKAKSVDHSYQNTVSLIHTMELVLDLPPMNQFDASSPPILDWDKAPTNSEPYTAVLPDEKIVAEAAPMPGRAAADPKVDELVKQSAAMDFTHADRAPAEELNRIIWASVKGTQSAMPATPSGPMEAGKKRAKDDDD